MDRRPGWDKGGLVNRGCGTMSEDIRSPTNIDMSSDLFFDSLVPGADSDSVTRSAPLRLLYVDENRESTEVTAEFIEQRSSIEVLSETSPTAALERLDTENRIDCILSNYETPLHGLELYYSVRENHPYVPFVLCSDFIEEDLIEKAVNAGVTDVIAKETLYTQQRLAIKRLKRFAISYRNYHASSAQAAVLKTIFEETSDCIIYGIVADDGVVGKDCNTAFERTFGVAREAIAGEPLTRVLSSPCNSSRIIDRWRQMSGDETETTICQYVTTDGVTDFQRVLVPMRQHPKTAGVCVILSEKPTREQSS